MWILTWLIGPIGRYVLIGVVAFGAIGGLYEKGRIDGKAAYQAKLTKQMNKAIQQGDQATADALKKFDDSKDIPDDGFARD